MPLSSGDLYRYFVAACKVSIRKAIHLGGLPKGEWLYITEDIDTTWQDYGECDEGPNIFSDEYDWKARTPFESLKWIPFSDGSPFGVEQFKLEFTKFTDRVLAYVAAHPEALDINFTATCIVLPTQRQLRKRKESYMHDIDRLYNALFERHQCKKQSCAITKPHLEYDCETDSQ